MNTDSLIKGLQILSNYYDKPGGYNTGANHDVVYGYPTDKPLTNEDVQKMIDLGWHQGHDEMNYNEDMKVSDYRDDESWHACV